MEKGSRDQVQNYSNKFLILLLLMTNIEFWLLLIIILGILLSYLLLLHLYGIIYYFVEALGSNAYYYEKEI